MEILLRYFPELTAQQQAKFKELLPLYAHWNEQINVISRKDLDNFYERHVAHSLAISKVVAFRPKAHILDVGTGGGFPGIPLAIMFPESNFVLVDSIGKKIKVVKEVAQALDLTNVVAHHQRAEQVEGTFDFVVSRAVTRMPVFVDWVKDKIRKGKVDDQVFRGILYLKGGDLAEEMQGIKGSIQEHLLSDYFKESFFETKKVVHWHH
ncbi:MAG: 16S rRNA (guanine(527)-N(7))-methyltransferase RsmG [Flavobacteriia bacterium]|nr:16S rRNA (guanine(527)-N(7))-methyltransferase RsmG [Flavobacteriia bacterium]